MEKTSRIPTAPGVDSTTRSSSSSLPAIFTITCDSFSFAIAALGSPLGSPKSFCTATRISGDSGFLTTRVKLFPSGQAFWMPLHNLLSSASGTSESLLPMDTTTAMFLTAATVEPPSIEAIHKRAVMRSHFRRTFCFIAPQLTFRQVTNSMFKPHCPEQVRFLALCPTVRLPSVLNRLTPSLSSRTPVLQASIPAPVHRASLSIRAHFCSFWETETVSHETICGAPCLSNLTFGLGRRRPGTSSRLSRRGNRKPRGPAHPADGVQRAAPLWRHPYLHAIRRGPQVHRTSVGQRRELHV